MRAFSEFCEGVVGVTEWSSWRAFERFRTGSGSAEVWRLVVLEGKTEPAQVLLMGVSAGVVGPVECVQKDILAWVAGSSEVWRIGGLAGPAGPAEVLCVLGEEEVLGERDGECAGC